MPNGSVNPGPQKSRALRFANRGIRLQVSGSRKRPVLMPLAHGRSGVDPAMPEVRIDAGGPEVRGPGLHALADLGRRLALGGEQPGEGRHEGRCLAGPALPVVATAGTGRQDGRPRGRQVHPATAAGEAGEPVVLVGGADGDDVPKGRRVLGARRLARQTLVSGGGHDHGPVCACAVDPGFEHAGLLPRAERKVDDVRAVAHAPTDAVDDVRVRTVTVLVQDPCHEQFAPGTPSRHAPVVVRERGYYACHVGAVAVRVVGHRVAADVVFLRRDLADVGMGLGYAGVDDGDPGPRPPGVVPGPGERGLLETPLAAEPRIVGKKRGGTDVVVVGGRDAGIVAEIFELVLEGSFPGRRLFAPYVRKRYEPDLSREVPCGPSPRTTNDRLLGVLGSPWFV